MKTTFTQVWVMVNNKVIGQADNIAEVNEVLTGYMNDFVVEGEKFDFSKVVLVNAVDHVQVDSSWMTHVPGKITVDEWEENDETEAKFMINSGNYRGYSFNYEEDVVDFLKEKIEGGHITAREASELEILKEPVLSGGIAFDQDLGEWEIDWDNMNEEEVNQLLLFGTAYVAVQDVPKTEKPTQFMYTEEEVDATITRKLGEAIFERELVSLNKPVEHYEDAMMMQAEAIMLMQRASTLMGAFKERTSGIVSVTSGDVSEE